MYAAIGNLASETNRSEWESVVRSVLVDAGLQDRWTEQERDGYLLLTFAPSADPAAVVDAVTSLLRVRASERFRPTVALSPDLWRFLFGSSSNQLDGLDLVHNTFEGQGTAVQAGVIIGDVVLPPTEQQLTALLDQLDRRRATANQAAEQRLNPKELDQSVTIPLSTPCFGRQRELAELRKALRHRRHVVVCGPSGIGKTTLLGHAAQVGVLSPGTVGDCAGVVHLSDPIVSGAGLIRTLLSECYDVDPDTPIPQATARRLLRSVQVLVVLEDVELPVDELRPVIRSMPHSVFVIESRRTDLWRLAVPVPVGGLTAAAGRALVEARLGQRLTGDEADDVEAFRQQADGLPDRLCQLVEHMRQASTDGTIGRIPKPAERSLIIPRLIGWLSEPSRQSLHTMAVAGDAPWGPRLITTLTGIAEDLGPAKLLHAPLARHTDDRYRLLAEVLDHLPSEYQLDPLDVIDQIAAWIVTTPRTRDVATEIGVLDRLLGRLITTGEFGAVLIVAWCASNRLTMSGYGAAWGVVLRHGLTAAVQAKSRRAETYFRYALAVHRMEHGASHEAIRYLTSIDVGDRHVAARVDALRTRIQRDADQHVLTPQALTTRLIDTIRTGIRAQWSAGLPLLRPVVRRLQNLVGQLGHVPGIRPVIRFAEQSPDQFRALLSAAAAVVAVAIIAASAPTPQQQPENASAPPVVSSSGTTSQSVGETTLTLPPMSTTRSQPTSTAADWPPRGSGTTTFLQGPAQFVPPTTTSAQPVGATPVAGPQNTCLGPWQLVGPWPISLNAVGGSAGDDVWAAGYTGSSNSARPLMEHWDGCHWSEASTPSLPNTSWLSSVSAPSRNMAWAVGAIATSTSNQTLIERWDGTAWAQVPSPSPGGNTDELMSVWAVSTTEAWAVGSTETLARQHSALILHWDGARWTQVPTPPPPGDQRVSLNGVSGTSPHDVWAVGTYELLGVYHPLIEHWDGHIWQLSSAPIGQLDQVTARSTDDVWAVGVTDGPQSVVLHWNGVSWANVPITVAASGATLSAVVPVTDKDVWVVGVQGQVLQPSTFRTVVDRWDGTGWHVVPTPGDDLVGGYLLDAVLIDNAIWTVGVTGQNIDQSVIERLPQ